jgi:hypothetical protein
MRWLGKAPVVYIYDRQTILGDMRAAGFVDIVEQDVGAEGTVAFIVAKKPAGTLEQQPGGRAATGFGG